MNVRFDQSAPYEVDETDVPFARIVPGAKHGFIGQEGAAAAKCIADMREFIGRHLADR